ncbi:hypothetical protein GCM10010275_13640 [Streptomyces litmocidini]|uniref:hypothetical protein n=1 Tax=Streptomyces litmocidini TaxID=67318 RepID=UPI00167D8253|nr:hypothetical protein [Streptomyces litmocidini]GGU80200.1 hypothetical protein GCM10010275_13640 [Streptomyces litmocidini]
MAGHHRYHLDQDGQSITVLHDPRRRRAEVWVNGKTVAVAPTPRHQATVLKGELPTLPPKPMVVTIDHPYDGDDVPPCVLEMDGGRYLMPHIALTPEEREPAERTPPARTPGELLARWRARRRDRRSDRRTRPGSGPRP